jgi:hypothetical protein
VWRAAFGAITSESPLPEERNASCVVLLSHTLNDTTLARYRALANGMPSGFDVVLALTEPYGEAVRALALPQTEILTPDEIYLPEYGAKAQSRRVTPGNTDLVTLAFARRRPWYRRIWLVEYDVLFPFGPAVLARLDAATDAELITSRRLMSRAQRPRWVWWNSFQPPESEAARLDPQEAVNGLCCICRYGDRLPAELDRAFRAGWVGHQEAVVPTITRLAGFDMEHLNEVAKRAIGRPVLTENSFRVRECAAEAGAMIYHPVKTLALEARLMAEIQAAGASFRR